MSYSYYDYYRDQLPLISELTEKSFEKQLTFFQSLLIVSVTLLGILISLHDNTTDTLPYRLLFAVAVVLLLFGILSCAVTLYEWSKIPEKARQKFATEVQNALKEDRKLKPQYLNHRKTTLVCEKATYILLLLSLLFLGVYSVMSTFS